MYIAVMLTKRKTSLGHIQKEERNVTEYHCNMNEIQRKAGREEQDPQ